MAQADISHNVSIIVPSYNQGRYIAATLDSILTQNYRPIEVLVIDGGSKDETLDVLRDYAARWPELKWWSEPDKGPAEAVNKGLARARGPIVGIQSSDDVYLPGAVSSAVEAFSAQPDASIVYADAYIINEAGQQITESAKYLPYTLERLLCHSTFILQSSAFFRLEEALAVGGWRPDYYVADLDMWLRMVFRRPAFKVDQVWSAFRHHGQQRNNATSNIFGDYWRMIEESEQIRSAPLKTRLAADAGRRMFIQFYNPTGSPWARAYQMWRALLTYPPVWHAVRWKSRLFPGYGRLTRWLRRQPATTATQV